VIAVFEDSFEDGEAEETEEVFMDGTLQWGVGDGEADVLPCRAIMLNGPNAALRNNANGVSMGVLDEPYFYRVPHLL
jgi:hypothetical protein